MSNTPISPKTSRRSRLAKLFNIDRESRKFYPTPIVYGETQLSANRLVKVHAVSNSAFHYTGFMIKRAA